jgi:ABC-type metal ion transport system substrate-binding protein
MNTILKITTLVALVALAACSQEQSNEAVVEETTEVVETVVESTEVVEPVVEEEEKVEEVVVTPTPAA